MRIAPFRNPETTHQPSEWTARLCTLLRCVVGAAVVMGGTLSALLALLAAVVMYLSSAAQIDAHTVRTGCRCNVAHRLHLRICASSPAMKTHFEPAVVAIVLIHAFHGPNLKVVYHASILMSINAACF